MKSNKRKINEGVDMEEVYYTSLISKRVDMDEVYDELESQSIKYNATSVARGVEQINWQINEEDIPLCTAGLLRNKVQLTNVQLVTYDEGEFTEWLENDQTQFDGGYQIVDYTGTTRYFGWNYGSERIKELFIQKKVIFTTKAPVTESKKLAKKSLKEGMNGCFYVIHESPIGYKGRQGWIDDYSELTSDVGSAEQYDTLQEAVDMLYVIEDYVENFNDGEGIRATIQCVNPDDPNQVLEDIAVFDIQKLGGMVDCEPVEGEQNLINCDYFGFNGADEELTEAYYNEGGQKIACVALTSAAVLAMAFGITQCNNKIADGELNKLDCLENYKKYNLDNQEGILHSIGIGDTHSKAMYAAIVSNAREKGMSIEESARDLTKNWKKKLSSEFRNLNSTLNQEGAIKAVRVGKGSDGTRIVEVTYQYRKRHTSGSGENKHTYHTTETGYVFIPCSEANQYGVDDTVDNGHHTVNIGGATFEFDEDASFANTYRMTSRDFNMWSATTKGLTTVKELDEGKAFACYIPEFSREYGRQMPKHIGTYVPSEGVLYCDDTKYFGHLV